MNQHALDVLEYQSLLEFLANYTDSEVTKEKILNLKPQLDHKKLGRDICELKEFRFLRSTGQEIPSFSGPEQELFNSVKSAKTRGWRLNPDKIYGIGVVLENSENIRKGFLGFDEIPLITQSVKQLKCLPELKKLIFKSIDRGGLIKNSASQDLARIRRNIRKLQEKLRSSLEQMAVNLYQKGFLQDPIVTIRNGRLVLPVKSSFAREIPGVIHDKSSSGATFFIEPKSSVSDSSALSNLEAEENREVNRILTDITEVIGRYADDITRNLNIIIHLDLLQAKARFSDEIGAEPIVPEKEPVLDLKNVKNPLLMLHRLYSEDGYKNTDDVVPISVSLDPDNRILVLTGPNTGGKTVALKTVGLTLLMTLTGLHPICDQFSRIGVFHNIFADIGDEQSLQQNLSTFSSHIKQIINILENADLYSLVLLDELGAGTDPAEGSALGISILGELLGRNVWAIANTHHNSIKAYAYTTQGIQNAAMEFDINTLKPTYRILMGRIGQSNALDIARRLSFPEKLLAVAVHHIDGKIQDLQKMIDNVEKRRITAEKHEVRASHERSRAKELRRAREDVLRKAEKDAAEIIQKATDKAQRILSDLVAEQAALKRELKLLRSKAGDGLKSQAKDRVRDTRQRIDLVADVVDSLRSEIRSEGDDKRIPGEILPGDKVWIKKLQMEGHVIKRSSDNKYKIDIKGKNLTIKSDELVRIESNRVHYEKGDPNDNRVEVNFEMAQCDPPPLRLNLVGKRVDEALDELQRYMDSVSQFKLNQVTVIHGFGTGRLQNAVVKFLKRYKNVSTARRGDSHEGGGGVTVVQMEY